jgi:hypothetical protein
VVVDMAEGFMGGLMEGLLSQIAPNYFNAMKQQEQDDAKSAKNKATAKLYADHIKGINAPLRAATSDPRRISIYDSMESIAAMQGEDIAKMFPEYFGDVIKQNLEDSNRSVVQKNADYVYNPAIPEQNREMVRQIEMSERPADIQERTIKQQNADTLNSYRKAQTSGALPSMSGRGNVMSNGMPPPKVKPGERYNPNTDQVEVLPGSDLERAQSESHSEDASKVSTMANVVDNMVETGNSLLNDEGFTNLFGKGDAATGALAYGTRYLSPGAMAKLEQFKNQLKTQGGALYKEIANSPGSMQKSEWSILEGQLATLSPGMPEKDARDIIKRALDFVRRAKTRRQELYAEQYADTPYYNPDISGESKTVLPPDLENMFTSRRGTYRYSEDSGLRKSIVDGSISINKDGRWIPSVLTQDGKGGFMLKEKSEDAPSEAPANDPKKAEIEQLRKELGQ